MPASIRADPPCITCACAAAASASTSTPSTTRASSSLDDAVGAGEPPVRKVDFDGASGLQVQGQVQSRHLLDRQGGGLRALQYPLHIARRLAAELARIFRTGHEAAGLDESTREPDSRQAVLQRKLRRPGLVDRR